MTQANTPYSRVAILLHWVIAVLVIGNLGTGLSFGWTEDCARPSRQVQVLAISTLHQSLGWTVALLGLLWLGWRRVEPPPPLPAHMTTVERRLARLTHAVFFLLMLALPLSGWALASTARAPILWFRLFEVPHLPIAVGQCGLFGNGHELFGWIMLVLIVLHGLAVIKHQLLDRDNVIDRMLPFIRRIKPWPF